jgi:hypothetical protein
MFRVFVSTCEPSAHRLQLTSTLHNVSEVSDYCLHGVYPELKLHLTIHPFVRATGGCSRAANDIADIC